MYYNARWYDPALGRFVRGVTEWRRYLKPGGWLAGTGRAVEQEDGAELRRDHAAPSGGRTTRMAAMLPLV